MPRAWRGEALCGSRALPFLRGCDWVVCRLVLMARWCRLASNTLSCCPVETCCANHRQQVASYDQSGHLVSTNQPPVDGQNDLADHRSRVQYNGPCSRLLRPVFDVLFKQRVFKSGLRELGPRDIMKAQDALDVIAIHHGHVRHFRLGHDFAQLVR